MSGKGLFLDMDGTAADSICVMEKVYESFLSLQGKQSTREEFDALNGPPLHEVVRILKDRHQLKGSQDELYEKYQGILFEVYSHVIPMPGVRELLEHARGAKWKTALVTSSTRNLVEAWLKYSGLDSLFDIIVTAEDVNVGKPSPEPYLVALEKTGCGPHDSIAVEDSLQGAQSALAAGLNVYGLGKQNWQSGVCPIPDLVTLKDGLSLVSHHLEQDVCFTIEQEMEQLPVTLMEKTDGLWKSITGLYDGDIVSVSRIEKDRIVCTKTHYRRFYAQSREPETFSGHTVHPLAVTGLLMSRDGIVFGLRSNLVNQDKGFWELAPAGGVDANRIQENASLDLVAQLAKEAKEELGIDTAFGNLNIAGMVEDPVNGVFDVGIIQALTMSADEIQENFKRYAGNEYDAIKVVSLDELNDFLATERVSAVSRKLLCMFYRIVNGMKDKQFRQEIDRGKRKQVYDGRN